MQICRKRVMYIIVLVIAALVAFFPTKGYDTYYFCTQDYSAMPGAEFVFHHVPCGLPRRLLAAALSVVDYSMLLFMGAVPPSLMAAFPLVGYTWRLEDDQLAYPLVILSLLLWYRRRRVTAIGIAALATLFWKGALVVFGAELLALVLGRWAAVPLFAWGAAHANSAIAEQSLLAGLLSALILLPAFKSRAKNDPLVWALGALSIVWGKWLWVLAPLLLLYYKDVWCRLPRWVKMAGAVAGIIGAILLAVVEFPQPLQIQELKEMCQHPSPQRWGIGWWCRAHGFNYPYAGSPPGGLRSAGTSNVVSSTVHSS